MNLCVSLKSSRALMKGPIRWSLMGHTGSALRWGVKLL